jgi:plasmid stabilization system protein ParE
MNTEQGFTLHPGAAHDITDIWEFILEDNALAAGRVREDILDAVRKLVPFPHQGHKRPDLTTKPLRFQAVRNYKITHTAMYIGKGDHSCHHPRPSNDPDQSPG